MTKTNTAILDALNQDLGLKDTVELLEFSLPFIIKREKELRLALLANDWSSASKYAHKTIGSAALYSSEELTSLLLQVKYPNEKTTNPQRLQDQLTKEFNLTIKTIMDWLESHSV